MSRLAHITQELAWNFVTIIVLLFASQHLPVDVTLVLVLITLLFGPILINLFFGILKFLAFLAAWAPNVFLALFCLGLFICSNIGGEHSD